ncbi:hypothetical protein LJC05_04970 [Bacteroides sp. OttesenSCG-928-J23]|nr:hypothetical protein [Bacteroides sp. OttesenSCG-928-J23]
MTQASANHSAAALTIANLKSKVLTPSYARGGYVSYLVPSAGKGARWIRIPSLQDIVRMNLLPM